MQKIPILVALRMFCARSVSVLITISAPALLYRHSCTDPQTSTCQCFYCRSHQIQDMTCCHSVRKLPLPLRTASSRLPDDMPAGNKPPYRWLFWLTGSLEGSAAAQEVLSSAGSTTTRYFGIGAPPPWHTWSFVTLRVSSLLWSGSPRHFMF